MRTVKVEILDRESVAHAIRELKAVKLEWQRKADLCSEMIAAAITDEINKNLQEITMTDDLKDIKTHQATPRRQPMAAECSGNRIYIQGTDIVFVEFGAGIYHNASVDNPLSEAVNFDTDIGSFGNGQGNKKYWFVAHNLISCGTPAYMPIHNAIETIKPQIPTLCRGVFV